MESLSEMNDLEINLKTAFLSSDTYFITGGDIEYRQSIANKMDTAGSIDYGVDDPLMIYTEIDANNNQEDTYKQLIEGVIKNLDSRTVSDTTKQSLDNIKNEIITEDKEYYDWHNVDYAFFLIRNEIELPKDSLISLITNFSGEVPEDVARKFNTPLRSFTNHIAFKIMSDDWPTFDTKAEGIRIDPGNDYHELKITT